MGHFTELLKIFLEKHFIKSILSVVFTIATYTYYPFLFGNIKSISEVIYILFIFLTYFISIHFAHTLYGFILRKIQDNKYAKLKNKKEHNELMESLWSYIDKFSPEDKKLLKQFIETKNEKPYICFKHKIDKDNFQNLYNKYKYMIVSDFTLQQTTSIDDYIPDIMVLAAKNSFGSCQSGSFEQILVQIKLEDEFFKHLKYSYETYGRISHFD